MTRKDYNTLLEELSSARQYINILIHDNTYAVINPHAYPHEYARVKDTAREMAVMQVPSEHNVNVVKRAIHTRHPGVILIAEPVPLTFVCVLAHDANSWCIRVKAAMNKAREDCTLAWTPTTGNPAFDFLTCRELILLTEPSAYTPFKEVIQ